MSFTMPYKKEKENDEKGSSRDKRLYRPLPDKAGSVVNNDVIIPLFSPHNWRMFNPTPEEAQKYGTVGEGLVSMLPSDPIETFYFRLPVHNVQSFNHPDGSVKFGQVLCPVGLNRYLTESLGRGPLFDSPRCAFCDEEQKHWDAYNAAWETCGTDKKSLSRDGYWKFVDSHPVLSVERDAARKFGADTRFVVSIFDHAKFAQQRPLDEGETGVEHQIWFAPKSIYQKLIGLYEAGGPDGFRFFEPHPQGFPILSIVKNTTECRAGDLRKTKYDINFVNHFEPYADEWVQYVLNQQAMIDPTDFVHRISYEEGTYYVAREQTSATEYGGAPATTGAPAAGQPAATGQQPPAGVPPATGFQAPPAGQQPATPGFQPPGSVSPDGYTVPGGALPPGQPPAGAPPAAAPPAGAPPAAAPPAGAPPAAAPLGGAPVPQQPPAAQPTPTTSPGGPVPVIGPAQGQPPGGTPPGAPGAPPAGAPPAGAPPAGAPPAASGAPPATTAPAQGQPPDRTPPAGDDPPGRRRSW